MGNFRKKTKSLKKALGVSLTAAMLLNMTFLSVAAPVEENHNADSNQWTLGYETNMNGPKDGVQGENGWYFMYTDQINADGALDVTQMKETQWASTGSCWFWYAQPGERMWVPDAYTENDYDPSLTNNWWMMKSDGTLQPNVGADVVSGAYVWEASTEGTYDFVVEYTAGSNNVAGDGVTISVNTKDQLVDKFQAPAVTDEAPEELSTGALNGSVKLQSGEKVYIAVDPNENGAYDTANLKISITKQDDETSGGDDGNTGGGSEGNGGTGGESGGNGNESGGEPEVNDPDHTLAAPTYDDPAATSWTLGEGTNTNGPTPGKQGANGWYFLYSEQINQGGIVDVSQLKAAEWASKGSNWFLYAAPGDCMWVPYPFTVEGYDVSAANNWWMMDSNGWLDTNVVNGTMTGAYAWAAPTDGTYDVSVGYTAGSKAMEWEGNYYSTGDGVTLSMNTKDSLVEKVIAPPVSVEKPDELSTGTMTQSVTLKAGELIYLTVDPNATGDYDTSNLKITINKQNDGTGDSEKPGEPNPPSKPEGQLTTPSYADKSAKEWTLGEDENINGPTEGKQGGNGWYFLYSDQINAKGALNVGKMKETEWASRGSSHFYYAAPGSHMWVPDVYTGEDYDPSAANNWWLMNTDGQLDTNVVSGVVSGAYAWAAPADGVYNVVVDYTAGSKAMEWEGNWYSTGDGVTLSMNTKDSIVDKFYAPKVSTDAPNDLSKGQMNKDVVLKAGELVYIAVDPNEGGAYDTSNVKIHITKKDTSGEVVPDVNLTKPTYANPDASTWTIGGKSNINGPESNGVQGSNGWYFLASDQVNANGALDVSKMTENEWVTMKGSLWFLYGVQNMWLPKVYGGADYDPWANNNWWLMDGNGRLDTNVNTGAVSGAYAWAAPNDGTYIVTVNYEAGSKTWKEDNGTYHSDGDGVTLSINTNKGVIDKFDAPAATIDDPEVLSKGVLTQEVVLKAGELVYVAADPKGHGAYDHTDLDIKIQKKGAPDETENALAEPTYEDPNATVWTMGSETNTNGPIAGKQGGNGWYFLYSEQIGAGGSLNTNKLKPAKWENKGSLHFVYASPEDRMWVPGPYAKDGYSPEANNNWWMMDGNGRLDTNVEKGAVSGAYAWAAPADGVYNVDVDYTAGSKAFEWEGVFFSTGDGVTLSLNTKKTMLEKIEAPAVSTESPEKLSTGQMNKDVELKEGELIYVAVDPNKAGDYDTADFKIKITKKEKPDENPGEDGSGSGGSGSGGSGSGGSGSGGSGSGGAGSSNTANGLKTKAVYDNPDAKKWTLGHKYFGTDYTKVVGKDENGPKQGKQGANGWYFLWNPKTNTGGNLNVGEFKECVWAASGSCYFYYVGQGEKMWVPDIYANKDYDVQGNSNWWMLIGDGYLHPNVNKGPVSGA